MNKGQAYADVETGQLNKETSVSRRLFPCVMGLFRLFNSSVPVSHTCWDVGICIGVFIVLIPVFVPTIALSLDIGHFPQLLHEPYKLALTLNVAFSVPMLIDALLDCINEGKKFGAERLRVLLAIGFMVPALTTVLLCFDGNTPNFRLAHAVLMAHQIVQYCLLYQLLNVHDRLIWADVRVTIMTFLHITVLITWSASFWIAYSLRYVAMCAFGLNNLMVFGIVWYLWIPKYWSIITTASDRHALVFPKQKYSWLTKYIFGLDGSIYSLMTADETISVFYIVTGFVLIVIAAVSLRTTWGFMIGTYAISSFAVLLTVYPGRVARLKAKESDAALESKKTFVQYISHEARGPLSVASMGLELHLMDLQQVMSEENSELDSRQSRQEWLTRRAVNVREVMDSCLVAQHTLNDLLTYDKIDSGMLQMEKVAISVFPFFQKELSPFSIQSRYKNISMKYNWGEGQVHPSYDNMTVFADQHKIAQVFRNLLSNALKFTPENGSIDVNVQVLCLFDLSQESSLEMAICSDSYLKSPESINTGSYSSTVMSAAGAFFKNNTGRGSGSSSVAPTALDSNSLEQTSFSLSQSRRLSERSSSRRRDKFQPSMGRIVSSTSLAEDCEYVDITEVDFSTIDRNIVDMVCRVEVMDSGPGISEENMSKLFGKYVQFNAAEMQQGGGSGLGLWLSKSIIELHGGDIGCTSAGTGACSRGSLFYFELPIANIGVNESPETAPVQGVGSFFNTPNDSGGPLTVDGSVSIVSPRVQQSAWAGRERRQSDINALMATSFDMHRDESTSTEVVVGADTYTASAGVRRNNSICAKKVVLLNIMVVDDAPLGRKMMSRAFRSIENSKSMPLMIRVHEGTDGTDAIAMMAKAASSRQSAVKDDEPSKCSIFYDLIFIDSEMANISGPEAIRIIRSEHKYCGSIHAVTGHACADSHSNLKQAGATSVFTKPLLVDQLRNVVEAYASSIIPNEMSLSNQGRLICTMNARSSPFASNIPGIHPYGSNSYKSSDNNSVQPILSTSKSHSSSGKGLVGDSGTLLNILVVDDTPVQRKILVRALRTIEHQKSPSLVIDIQEGCDGTEAVALVKSSVVHFDLIFMDYDMPKLDGGSAIRAIREDLGHHGPIYAVTANENSSEHDKLQAAGATRIFIKPVKLQDLTTIVESKESLFLSF